MPPTRIHLVRHGQGYHNVESLEQSRLIHDAHLTELGIRRCRHFNDELPKDIHIDLVCASPVWLTIQTAAYCFHDVIPPDGDEEDPPVAGRAGNDGHSLRCGESQSGDCPGVRRPGGCKFAWRRLDKQERAICNGRAGVEGAGQGPPAVVASAAADGR